MPAALVELGYMTNLSDLALICNEDFQWKMAEIIAKSVVDYENKRTQ
jgi:N-acetylmuramoyl-L-alanine amidase